MPPPPTFLSCAGKFLLSSQRTSVNPNPAERSSLTSGSQIIQRFSTAQRPGSPVCHLSYFAWVCFTGPNALRSY
jgi:hypothetical protein